VTPGENDCAFRHLECHRNRAIGNQSFSIVPKVSPLDHSTGTAGITCRNGSRPKSYWTKTRQGIKLVNALSEESVGQSNNGLEANPTTDSSLKPARGE